MSGDLATMPARRRRQSHSGNILSPIALAPGKSRSLLAETDTPPRPKSTPAHDRPHARRRASEVDDEDEGAALPATAMQVDHDHENSSDTSSSSDSAPPSPAMKPVANAARVAPQDRPTRPLPASKARKMLSANNNSQQQAGAAQQLPPATQTAHTTTMQAPQTYNSQQQQQPTAGASRNPLPVVANPHMLPVQAVVPKNSSGQRRLFVILEQACLEAYRVSSAARGKGGNGKEGDVKYALLNCDDHQGILAKAGRDIADARPDITHQVRFRSSVPVLVCAFSIVFGGHPGRNEKKFAMERRMPTLTLGCYSACSRCSTRL